MQAGLCHPVPPRQALFAGFVELDGNDWEN